jgi:hypothetical protein
MDCTGYLLLTPSEYQVSQVVDPAQVAEIFSYGFALVMASYLGGWAVGQVLKTLRSARR